MRRAKVLVGIALSSIVFLVLLYSSLSSDEGHARQEDHSASIEEIVISMTPSPVRRNTVRQLPPSTAPPVVISEAFRSAVPQSGAYWNRKQHSFFRKRDLEGNVSKVDSVDWLQCSAVSVESLSTNIQDFNSYPGEYQDFLRGMECSGPPLLIDQPAKCQSEGAPAETYLLFAIKSVPRSFERRQAVRQTWGQEKVYEGGLRVRIVFLLGMWLKDDPNLEQQLSFEAQFFGDLLQWDFKDTFYNLTLKENAFFQWALARCPQVSFIFKGDDDVFVNTQGILDYLRTLDPKKASTLYLGHIISDTGPVRDANSKYYVPNSFYEGNYSPYAGGGGFLFSGGLLPALYRVSKYIPFFPIDDVYTGMCFQALGISPETHKGFQTFDIRKEDRENACAHKSLLLVHQRTPQQTLRLWRYVHSPLLSC